MGSDINEISGALTFFLPYRDASMQTEVYIQGQLRPKVARKICQRLGYLRYDIIREDVKIQIDTKCIN